MRRLLKANVKRLFKTTWFWLCVAASAAWTLFAFICECYNTAVLYGDGFGTGAADSIVLDTLGELTFVMAVFVCMFIGEEYSNKTIRNKIVVGHSKANVYLSNAITCILGALLMYLLHFAVFTFGGLVLLGPFQHPRETLICFLCGLVGVAAKVSIFVFIAMLISRKSVSVIVAILLTYFMMTFVLDLQYRLEQPVMYEETEYDWDTGEVIGTQIVDNPYYIKNDYIRAVCAFVVDCFPQGQDYTYSSSDYVGLPENIELFPVYSVVFFSVFTGSGILIFQRKNLK